MTTVVHDRGGSSLSSGLFLTHPQQGDGLCDYSRKPGRLSGPFGLNGSEFEFGGP